jgi:hypothetical protein
MRMQQQAPERRRHERGTFATQPHANTSCAPLSAHSARCQVCAST